MFESSTLAKVRPSPTLAALQRALDRARSGHDIASLAAGEPDFPTPSNVKAAAIRAIDLDRTRYTAADGCPELKSAIAEKFSRENHLSYQPENIHVAPGAKAVIFNALMATVSPGDEVIVPSPYWASYPDMVRLVGGDPAFVETRPEHGFKIRPEQLDAAVGPRTKWLVLNSPSNPTGSVYEVEELQALASVLIKHPNVLILCDNIYEHLLFDGRRFSTLAEVEPELLGRVLTVSGVSKGYAMTGWRIGFAGGPAPLVQAMAKVISQTTSNACTVSQWAAVEALSGPQDFLREFSGIFERRRNLLLSLLAEIPGIACLSPAGTFYAFASVRDLFGRPHASGPAVHRDSDFAQLLLDRAGVVTVPGSAFGQDGYLRLSFASSSENIATACQRLGEFCAQFA